MSYHSDIDDAWTGAIGVLAFAGTAFLVIAFPVWCIYKLIRWIL